MTLKKGMSLFGLPSHRLPPTTLLRDEINSDIPLLETSMLNWLETQLATDGLFFHWRIRSVRGLVGPRRDWEIVSLLWSLRLAEKALVVSFALLMRAILKQEADSPPSLCPLINHISFS